MESSSRIDRRVVAHNTYFASATFKRPNDVLNREAPSNKRKTLMKDGGAVRI